MRRELFDEVRVASVALIPLLTSSHLRRRILKKWPGSYENPSSSVSEPAVL
jgi:hypothetical protein